MSTFLPFDRRRAALLTVLVGAATAGVCFALAATNGSRSPLLWVALVGGSALFVLGAMGLFRQRGGSGLTISDDGITRQIGPKRLHYPWVRIEEVRVLDLAPGATGIHLRLTGDPTTRALGTAALVGGTSRALEVIRAALDAVPDPPPVVDTRRPPGSAGRAWPGPSGRRGRRR